MDKSMKLILPGFLLSACLFQFEIQKNMDNFMATFASIKNRPFYHTNFSDFVKTSWPNSSDAGDPLVSSLIL